MIFERASSTSWATGFSSGALNWEINSVGFRVVRKTRSPSVNTEMRQGRKVEMSILFQNPLGLVRVADLEDPAGPVEGYSFFRHAFV